MAFLQGPEASSGKSEILTFRPRIGGKVGRCLTLKSGVKLLRKSEILRPAKGVCNFVHGGVESGMALRTEGA